MKKLYYFILFIALFGCQKQQLPVITEDHKEVLVDSTLIKDDNLFGDENENQTGVGSSGTTEEEVLTTNPPPTESKQEDSVYVKPKLQNESNTSYIIDNGRILYVVPDTMLVMKNYEIVIRISKSNSQTTISQNIQRKDKVKTEQIKTTSKMQVELIDPQKDCFNITSVNSSKQLVDSTYTEWKFNVQPIKSGTNRLDLVVSIFLNEDLKQVSYSDEIFVKANPKAQIKDFWSTNWKWIFEKLVLPLVTWFIGYWMGKKKK